MQLSKEDILAKVSVHDIQRHFAGQYQIDKLYKCPFHNERSASFHFMEKGGLKYKCFGCGTSGDIFKYIMHIHACNFKESLALIAKEFLLDDSIPEKKKKYKSKAPHVNIGIRKEFMWQERPFPEFGEQIEFWTKYGITRDILSEYDVRNINWYTFKGKAGQTLFKEARSFDPIFGYFHESKGPVKFYRPNTIDKKWNKWSGNTMEFDVWGQRQITKRQEVIIWTAGEKDGLSLYANTGIRGVNSNSESALPPSHKYEEVRSMCNHVFVLYDNDEAGEKSAIRMKLKFGTPILNLSTITGEKDISRYYEQLNKSNSYENKIQSLVSDAISGQCVS